MADTEVQTQMVDEMRRAMGGALQQISNDLLKLDKVSRDAVGTSGGIGRLDGAFMGVASRLLGPVGVVAGLYQVSNALSNVAAQSVQMQTFARNTGLASDNIKNMQLQLEMSGKSAAEAKSVIGGLAGTLNDFNVNRNQSSLHQTLLGKTGGADLIEKLKETKNVTEQIALLVKTYNAQPDERSKRGFAALINVEPSDFEAFNKLVANTFAVNTAEMQKYHENTVVFNRNVSESWNAISGNIIVELNKITGGMEGSGKSFETFVGIVNKTVSAGFGGMQAVIDNIKRSIGEVETALEWVKKISGNTWKADSAASGATDPIGADNAAGQFDNGLRWDPQSWKFRGKLPSLDRNKGTSGSTDFSGMRRNRNVEDEEQTEIQKGILGTLKRIEEQGETSLGDVAGGGRANGSASGGGRQGLGRRLGIDGGGESGSTGRSGGPSGVTPFAGKGARGAGTATAMQAAREQLRAEGVPEANIEHAAAALTGQAQAESSLNPNTSHDGGTGYGIYGARDPGGRGKQRKTEMLNWLKENGYANNSLEGQMKYMAHEAMTDKSYAQSRKALMGANADNIDETANTLTTNFERPKVNNFGARAAHARAALNGITPAPGNEGGQSEGGKDGTPSAFIMHHTGGRGTPEGVRNTLQQRGLGVQYIMDRDGNIVPGGGDMRSHMKKGQGVGAGLSNANTVGMEIIAKNDRDVTPAQIKAAREFIAGKYPNTPVFGHGQVNPHKEGTEGSTVVNAINEERAARKRMEESTSFSNRFDAVNGNLNASIDFKNVPNGVTTSVQGEGFKELQVSKSRQGEVAGGSPGQPFAGVW